MVDRQATCAACAAPCEFYLTLCRGCIDAKEAAYKKVGKAPYAEVLGAWLDALEARGEAAGIPKEEVRARLWDTFFRPRYGALRREELDDLHG